MRRPRAVSGLPILFILLIGLAQTCTAYYVEWGEDLEGPWCAQRYPGEDCCFGRDDDCSVPFLGVKCYCDIFCNDTAADCCPDYWAHCLGEATPTTTTPRPTTPRTPMPVGPCWDPNGRHYRVGDGYTENCNTCKCTLVSEGPFRRSEWRCTDHVCLIRPELINEINDGPYSWRASNYSALWGMTLDQGLKYRLGTFPLGQKAAAMTPLNIEQYEALPPAFDAREKWPGLLDPIHDQGNCGSSWAHSSTAVASDRLSVETLGLIKERMSVQHLISCDTEKQQGCEGGHVDRAWWYLRHDGVVTEECYPHTSRYTERTGACLLETNQTSGFCPSGITYNEKKRYQVTPPYPLRPDERDIMHDIVTNGPVQATFLVREDFFMYKGGVYSYAALPARRGEGYEYNKSGYHSVRILGWDVEILSDGSVLKYWICANSWGTDWGEDGYFRIVRGSDESEIESMVIGVWGKIVGDPILETTLDENRQRRLWARTGGSGGRPQLRSLDLGRIRRRRKKAERRMRRQKKKNKPNKKKGKAGSKKLSRKERQERRRARRQRRLRRQKKAKLAKLSGIGMHSQI